MAKLSFLHESHDHHTHSLTHRYDARLLLESLPPQVQSQLTNSPPSPSGWYIPLPFPCSTNASTHLPGLTFPPTRKIHSFSLHPKQMTITARNDVAQWTKTAKRVFKPFEIQAKTMDPTKIFGVEVMRR